MRWLSTVTLLAGCETVFPLEGPPPVDAPVDQALVCPDAYDIAGVDTQYRALPGFAPWAAQEAACQLDGPIHHLVVPNSALELKFIQTQIITTRQLGNTWIGVGRQSTSAVAKASFQEITGAIAQITLWQPGEPSNGNGAEFAVVISEGLDFTDIDFNEPHAGICECDGMPPIAFDWQ